MFFALLRHRILAQKPDVVVSHLDVTNLRVLVAMYETNVPVIALRAHGCDACTARLVAKCAGCVVAAGALRCYTACRECRLAFEVRCGGCEDSESVDSSE